MRPINKFKKSLSLISAIAVALIYSINAHADDIQVIDVQGKFSDGEVLSGDFSYDYTTQNIIQYNISVTGGPAAFNYTNDGYSYTYNLGIGGGWTINPNGWGFNSYSLAGLGLSFTANADLSNGGTTTLNTTWLESGTQYGSIPDYLVSGTATTAILANADFSNSFTVSSSNNTTNNFILNSNANTGNLTLQLANQSDASALGTINVTTNEYQAGAGTGLPGNFSLCDTVACEVWNITPTKEPNGTVTLTFNFDPALYQQANSLNKTLEVMHYNTVTGQWEHLQGTIDYVNDTITVTTTSLSPFVLTQVDNSSSAAAVPEPEMISMFALGLLGLSFAARKKA